MSSKPINILLLEDNPLDARLLRLQLGEKQGAAYHLTHKETLQQGIALLGELHPDLILCDLSLPDSHELETFQRLHAVAPRTPIIVLSGSDDETLAVQAVREGAQDYLVKGRVDAQGLIRAISYALERHRTERALHENEQLYKRLLESITDYVYTVYLEDGRPVRTEHGPGCITITGYTPEELLRASDLWYRMVEKEDRPAVLNQVTRLLSGQSPPPLEHRILRKSGQTRWVRHTLVPNRDENGTLVTYTGLLSDISDRKLAEEKLVNSEAFYHSLVENLPQNIFRKDLNERFTFANQRFCAMLGKSLDQIIDRTDFDFYPAELATKYQQDDRWVIETGRIFETIEENQSPGGQKIYVQVVKTPIYDAHGQILGTQCIFWDITERKRFEERLQKANEELARNEQALRHSNEALRAAQMQLIQAEKMESIGTLAAGVAHEVKNPLAILMMGLSYLKKKLRDAGEQVTGVLYEMGEAIERADSITKSLLDFSSNRQLAMQSEDLNDILRGTLRMLRHGMNEKRIQLTTQWGRRLHHVAIDKRQIQQVLVNVLMNAIQAMPEGGRISIKTFETEVTETTHSAGSRSGDQVWVGDTVVITVIEDNGPGIPQEILSKIFDPFFTTKPTGQGTGLGLAVSRKIIELHGGTLDIKNRDEGGVRVTLTLKACKP